MPATAPLARQPWTRRHPRLVDALVALVAFVATTLAVPPTPDAIALPPIRQSAWSVALIGFACALLMLRRQRPVLVWTATLVIGVLPTMVLAEPGRGLAVAVVALYAVAVYAGRPWSLGATAVTVVVVLVTVAGVATFSWTSPVTYAVAAWCALAAAVGDAVRSHRAAVQAAVDRARAAEASAAEHVRASVAEERLRISRELHDVVGHHLAVVNVQAGVAQHFLSAEPARADAALAQVREASRRALAETGLLVGLLRPEGDDEPGAPTPTLSRLPDLVEAARAAGTPVSWTHRGPVPHVSSEGDLHAYRVVQEALTNAARHGCGEIGLRTTQDNHALRIEVRNLVSEEPSGPLSAGGHGLIGMRERADLCGGTFAASRSAEGFVVTAVFPVAGAPA